MSQTVMTQSLDGNSVNSVDQIQKFTEMPIKSTGTYPFTLSWSHYLVLMCIESDDERRFYEIEAQKQNWSVRQLQRQFNSSLYERLALSKDKDSILRLAQEGQAINNLNDIIKNPLTLWYVKQDFEKPTIGILLCKEKKDALVELTRSLSIKLKILTKTRMTQKY